MEKFNRAERRHQLARIKAKRKDYWGHNTRWCGPMTPTQLGMVANSPAVCSQPWCCGNPRSFYGRTLKEIVDQITLKEEYHAVVNSIGKHDEQNVSSA